MEIPETVPDDPSPVIPAATVVVVRDREPGLEVLMLRRNAKGMFGGMWVFPGGRVDPDDADPAAPGDELAAARRAAAREAAEEAALALDPAALVPISHWTPPVQAPRRFATWFFLAAASAGHAVEVDGGEIHEHAWWSPDEALARQQADEIELAPPTWVSLWNLSQCASVAEALERARADEPEHFATHVVFSGPKLAAVWHGDAAYDTGDIELPGGRHRLWMMAGRWRYERSGTGTG
jgi:8-oxo-dGTP pyrophosphatase MutT (NUDIX family)